MRTPFRSAVLRFFLALFLAALVLAALVSAILWTVHPFYLTRAINRRLKEVPGYRVRIMRAEVRVLPGRLLIDGVRIEKSSMTAPGMFLTADRVSANLSWVNLLRGRLEVDVALDRPRALFLMRQRKPDQPRKAGLWQAFCAERPPFRLRRLDVRNGALRLRNDEDIPPLDISFDGIIARASNMGNRADLLGRGPALLEGRCRFMDHAPLWMSIEAIPFSPHAEFRFKGRLTDFQLKTLNPILRYYTGTDIEAGLMDVEGALTAGDGVYSGTVKRNIRGLDVLGRQENHLTFIQRMKEFVFEMWLRRKAKEGALEAGYSLSGPLGFLDKDPFLAGVWVAKTSFLQSLRPVLPEEVGMGSPEEAEEEWMALQARERLKINKKTPQPI